MKKILLLGDAATGKTAFLSAFLHKQIQPQYDITKGVQAGVRTVQFTNNKFINVQIWDTPGQQNWRQCAYFFYKNIDIFIVVVDRSNLQTLKSLQFWLDKIQQQKKDKKDYEVIVFANQTVKNKITFGKIEFDRYYANNRKLQYFEFELVSDRETLDQTFVKPNLRKYLIDQIQMQKIQQTEQQSKKNGVCNQESCIIM